jgi:hypothetical protein
MPIPGATMTLAKESLIQSLYDQCGLSKPTSRTLIETTFELIKKALESGDNVLISGFGKFSIKEESSAEGKKSCDRGGFDSWWEDSGWVQVLAGVEGEGKRGRR